MRCRLSPTADVPSHTSGAVPYAEKEAHGIELPCVLGDAKSAAFLLHTSSVRRGVPIRPEWSLPDITSGLSPLSSLQTVPDYLGSLLNSS